MTRSTSALTLLLVLLGSEIAWVVWKRIRERFGAAGKAGAPTRNKALIAADNGVDEVLMFTEIGKLCRDHANTRSACDKSGCPVGNLTRIHWYLSGAAESLDVCMYVMTCDDLTACIVKARKRGAQVRIVVDSGMSELPACNDQLLRIRRAGIEIRANKLEPSTLMHHKYAVIDRKLLMLGSTNWTMQAFYGNNDSILVTHNRDCVKAYSDEFERMWQDFAPRSHAARSTRGPRM